MKKSLFILLLLCLPLFALAQFTHPGMLHTKADLDFLKKKVRSGEEPWATRWKELQESPLSSLWRTPQPYEKVIRGPYHKPDIGAKEFTIDGHVAYTMALQWAVTGKKAYAEKAIEYLDAWSNALDSVVHHDRQLLVGLGAIYYLNAAEIIKHTYKGWSERNEKDFERMVLGVLYPVIKDFVPRANGNWDASMIQTMMCMGVYFDRQDIFDRAYDWALDGDSNGAIDNYFLENGQCQESGRDQGHTQLGLGWLNVACEVAWNQGYDLYSAYDNRLMKGYEYTAKYNLGEEVPHVQYVAWYGRPVYGPEISAQGRGRFSPIWIRAYRHYHDRMGMEMPYTKRVIDRYTPESNTNLDFVPWSTLTSYGFPTGKSKR